MTVQTMPRADEDAPLQGGPITVLRSQLEQRAAEFAMVLPSHITPDKFQRTVLTAVQTSPDLLKADRRSLLTACMKAAQDGLLPDGREAAIVTFNTRTKQPSGKWEWVKLAQYMPMVFGLRKKILQSGEITDLFASVVYRQEIEAGKFVYEEGTERTLRHKPILDPDFRPDDADIALAYSVATFSNGFKSFQVMRRYELDEVRETSQTGAQYDADGNPRDSKGPWRDWFGEMCKKSVIRRHSKTLPQSGDILADVEADDMDFAAQSAVALLGSQEPDRPTTFAEFEGFDPETGELLTEGGDGPEPEPDLKPPPKPEPKPEPAVEQPAETEAPAEGAAAPGVDEIGVTKTEWDEVADEMIARARKVELIADLNKLEQESELQLDSMPSEIASCVDEEFAAARKRLTPPRQRQRDGK